MHSQPVPTVKIHGIFRSGTNLAKFMLQQQFECAPAFHLGGHKHLPLPCIPGTTEHAWTRTVVCVKNPLASLVSLFRYAQRVRFKHFDCGRTWDRFLRRRMVIRIDGSSVWPAYRFADPVDYWNAFYANAFSIPAEHLFILNYEALLRDPALVMDQLAERFPDLTRTNVACTLPGNKVSRGTDSQAQAILEENAFEDAAWYQERRYLAEFDDTLFAYVTRRIDRDVLGAAGYQPRDIERGG
jgi:hypothetical protein